MGGLKTEAQLKQNGSFYIGLPIPYTDEPTERKNRYLYYMNIWALLKTVT